MNTPTKFPLYAKLSLLIIGLYFFISMLSIAQDILLPIIYALIIATLLSPAVNYLVKKKLNRAVSIALILVLSTLVVAGFIALLISQASTLSEAGPQLADKFQNLLNQIVIWASGYFNISAAKINDWISNERLEMMNNSRAVIGTTLVRESAPRSASPAPV